MASRGRRRLRLALIGACLSLPAAAGACVPAQASDPGRWTETGLSSIPLYYYQGVASDPGRRLFFNGIHVGLYRTDAELNETARSDDVIPAAVHATENYNHVGDIAWDAREGGRILLPLECYYPRAAPGQDDPNNTCNTGSIGVADPDTLEWRYYVKLDPAEIPKAMWAIVSPDGELMWTQSGKDLLAYSMDDIAPAKAAPGGPVVKAVRKLAGAVPPSGITGAVFFRGRLFVAGQNAGPFQVYSIDLDSGQRTLEIEKEVIGESEGLDVFQSLGGILHWMIQPYNEDNVPTYGVANGTLLHFVPRGERAPGPAAKRSRIRVSVTPRRVRPRKRVRFRFQATAKLAGRRDPVGDARVRLNGRTVRTDAKGRAKMTLRLGKPGLYRVSVTRDGLADGRRWVRVARAG